MLIEKLWYLNDQAAAGTTSQAAHQAGQMAPMTGQKDRPHQEENQIRIRKGRKEIHQILVANVQVAAGHRLQEKNLIQADLLLAMTARPGKVFQETQIKKGVKNARFLHHAAGHRLQAAASLIRVGRQAATKDRPGKVFQEAQIKKAAKSARILHHAAGHIQAGMRMAKTNQNASIKAAIIAMAVKENSAQTNRVLHARYWVKRVSLLTSPEHHALLPVRKSLMLISRVLPVPHKAKENSILTGHAHHARHRETGSSQTNAAQIILKQNHSARKEIHVLNLAMSLQRR